MRIPDYFSPLIAWRGWRIGPDGGLYGPARTAALWIPGEPCRALCDHMGNSFVHGSRHASHAVWEAPVPGCTCGFYSFKTLQNELMSLLREDMPFLTYASACLGQVKIWGRIIEHVDGYRSQYAYPHAIIVGSDAVSQRQIETLRKEYRIEVETVPNITRFLQKQIDTIKGA